MKSTPTLQKISPRSLNLSDIQYTFLQTANDLTEQYWKNFSDTCENRAYHFIHPEQLENIYYTLISHKIIHLVARPVVLELNIARQLEELQGDTPYNRFHYFLNHLDKNEFRQLYPALSRLLHTTLHNFNAYLLEIFDNYTSDWKTLFPSEAQPPCITNISADLLDVYPDGRCVAILSFDNALKWVYKPRDCAVDVAFQSLLSWFNTKNQAHPFKLLNIISRETYSWNEFAKQSETFSKEQIKIAYQKIGSVLCLFYLFDAIDMHRENCILSDDNICLIDLETLLQPRVQKKMYRTLRHTHFLPSIQKEVLPDQDDLHYAQENVKEWDNKVWTSEKSFCWKNEGQDTMQILRRRILVGKSDSRLIVDGQPLNPLDYLQYMSKGFRKTYRFIEANKTEFLEKVNTLFNGLKIRVIVRATKKYDALIDEMTHPAILESEAKLEDFLAALNVETDNSDDENLIIDAEKKHLSHMTNPSFFTLTNQKGLYTEGGQLIPDYFETDALTVVQLNIAEMNNQDLGKQIRILQRSFKCLKPILT